MTAADATAETLLEVADIGISFGGINALSGVGFAVAKGAITAIIGPNGAGKSSMLNVINGFYQPESGTITYKGQHVGEPVLDGAAADRPPIDLGDLLADADDEAADDGAGDRREAA